MKGFVERCRRTFFFYVKSRHISSRLTCWGSNGGKKEMHISSRFMQIMHIHFYAFFRFFQLILVVVVNRTFDQN